MCRRAYLSAEEAVHGEAASANEGKSATGSIDAPQAGSLNWLAGSIRYMAAQEAIGKHSLFFPFLKKAYT